MDKVIVDLEQHGRFIARLKDVQELLSIHSKRRLIHDCLEYWPEVFTRKELKTYSNFVLAVILRQQ